MKPALNASKKPQTIRAGFLANLRKNLTSKKQTEI